MYRIPCLEKQETLQACHDLTWPTSLYPKSERLNKALVKGFIEKSQWAKESDTLTTAFLNYIGSSNYYKKDNTSDTSTTRSSRQSPEFLRRQAAVSSQYQPSPRLGDNAPFLAYPYQQCTELGLFQTTPDASQSNALPIQSKLITLHYLKDRYCRNQLHIPLNETGVSAKLIAYGGFNISYPRLMLTGGEVDPVSRLWHTSEVNGHH